MDASNGEISGVRKLGAFASMLTAGGLVAWQGRHFIDWTFLGGSIAALSLVGVALTRRSLVVQVLARGAAWLVLAPTLFVSVFELITGRMPGIEAGFAATTGLALLLARPMLHTEQARAAFAPRVFRRLFLAGSTASAALAWGTGVVALEGLRHEPLTGAALAGLATAYLASSVAVLRMRSWGIVLGVLTSLALLAAALVVPSGPSLALLFLAAPGLLLYLTPVLVARKTDTPGPRVDATGQASFDAEPAVRIRIDDDVVDLDEHAEAPAPARALAARP